MKLLLLVSWQYARRHRLRWLLTTFGILLGVAIFVGMHAAGDAVLKGLSDTVDRIAGKTQLQVTAGEAGFSEEFLEKVQAEDVVETAAPAIEAVVPIGVEGEGNMLILAVDMTGDGSLRDYDFSHDNADVVDDPLIFLAQPDSLIVTEEFARRNGLAVDSTLPMQTMDGAKRFTIRGIMSSNGLGSAYGGNLAVMDIYAAQVVFGRGRRFDRIDIRLKEGLTIEEGQARLQAAMGPGFQVEAPASRGRQFESLLNIYSLTVDITSLFALVIGMFIIYNGLGIAVTQRRSEIGILRALGATRGQILCVFLVESAIAGLIGSILGVLFGMAIASVVSGYVVQIFDSLYGVLVRPGEITFAPVFMTAAVAMGILTSIVAALIPARNAARVDPIKALQRGRDTMTSGRQSRSRPVAAGVFAIIAVICVELGDVRQLFFPGYLSFLVAVLLLIPTLTIWLARLVRPIVKTLRPVEGALAIDSVIRSPRRTSPTVAALMLSIGLIVSLGGVARSSYDSIADWADTAFSPDLFVSASQNLVERSFHFPDSMTPQLAAIDGVEEVDRMRTSKVSIRGATALLIATEMDRLAERTRGRSVVAGNFDEMHRLAAEGNGVVVSEIFSSLQGFGMGDTVELTSPFSTLRLPIVGIVRDYTYQSGSLFIDYSVYLKYWNDPSVDLYRIYLAPEVSPEEAKQRILSQFGNTQRLFVFLSQEIRSLVLSNTEQWLNLIYIQIVIAILVAVLGIATTLTVSIIDRRRELGILRAVGGLPFQIRLAIWLEAAAISIVGVILGIAFGVLDLSFELEMVHRYYAGMTLDYSFPFGLMLILCPAIIAAGVIAALAPSESAVRRSLVEALESE